MEPHREEEQKALEPSATPKPKRFRIIKLEERIAPSAPGVAPAHKATAMGSGCPTNGPTCNPPTSPVCNYTWTCHFC